MEFEVGVRAALDYNPLSSQRHVWMFEIFKMGVKHPVKSLCYGCLTTVCRTVYELTARKSADSLC